MGTWPGNTIKPVISELILIWKPMLLRGFSFHLLGVGGQGRSVVIVCRIFTISLCNRLKDFPTGRKKEKSTRFAKTIAVVMMATLLGPFYYRISFICRRLLLLLWWRFIRLEFLLFPDSGNEYLERNSTTSLFKIMLWKNILPFPVIASVDFLPLWNTKYGFRNFSPATGLPYHHHFGSACGENFRDQGSRPYRGRDSPSGGVGLLA